MVLDTFIRQSRNFTRIVAIMFVFGKCGLYPTFSTSNFLVSAFHVRGGAGLLKPNSRIQSRQLNKVVSRNRSKTLVKASSGFDFETVPDRTNTGSLKTDKYAGRDIIPLWVADMDFKTCPAITTALEARIRDGGVFGYTMPTEAVKDAVVRYLGGMGLHVNAEDIFFSPGAVQTLHLVCRLIPRDGGVMVFTPIYPPFHQAPVATKRELVCVPLTRAHVPSLQPSEGSTIQSGGHADQIQGEGTVAWTFDFEEMERSMQAHPNVGLVMMCNPHNPVGRVFTEAELKQLGEFCERHNLLIMSDEIHCDLILDVPHGHKPPKHIPMATVDGGRFAARTITVNAPSKTFNVPGLGCSYAVVQDRQLRRRLFQVASGIVTQNPTLGYTGCEAAYNEGRPWRNELVRTLTSNRDLIYEFLSENIPDLITLHHMEATYLAWLDVRRLRWRDPIGVFERGGVGLTDGVFFKAPGYVRLNFGLPQSRLLEGLERMKATIDREGIKDEI